MVAGQLEIQFSTDLARLSSGVQDVRSMMRSVSSDASKMAETVKGALGALGVGVSVAGVVELVRSTIDAMDHLNDLSKTTNLTVETLAGLDIAAKQTGTNLETMTTTIDRLAVNMGKGAEKFAALGVSARDPLEALKQLSDRFVSIQDPQLRAAVMAEALGKGWQAAAPLLAEGSARIGEMVSEGSRLSGVTTEMAQQADAFNDKLVKLVGTHGLLHQQIGAALPLLNKLADDLLELQNSTGGASMFATAFAEALRAVIVLGGNVAFVLHGVYTEVVAIATQIVALLHLDFSGFAEIHREAVKNAEDARVKFDAWEASIMKVGTAMRTTAAAVDYGDQATRRAASEASAAARAFLQSEKDKATAADLQKTYLRMLGDANKAYSVAVAEAANGSDKLTISQKKLLEIVSDPEFKKLTPAMQQEIKDRLSQAAAVEQQNVVLQRQVALLKEENDEVERFRQEWSDLMARGEDRITSLQDQIDTYKVEITVLGQTAIQRDLALLQLQRERDLRDVLNKSTRAGINTKYDELEVLMKTKAAREQELALYNSLGDAAGKFFGDLLEGGKKAFDNLKQWAKQFAEEMIAIFAKRWILQLAATASGSSTLAGAAENAGANTLAGSVLQYAGGALGITGAGGFMTGLTAGYAGIGGVEGLSVAGTIGEGIGTLAGGAADVLAAMGPVGWIALAALAAYAIFGGKGGGPKGGGSFAGNFDGTGQFTGAGLAAGTQNGRLFTPATDDASMQSLVTSLGQSFAQGLAALGGTSNGVTFALGYDTDPHGRAGDRVSSVVSGPDGNILYQNINQDTGASLQGTLSLEAQRMLLAALQASTLPKQVADILNTVVAAGASAEDIQKVIAAATEMAGVIKALPTLGLHIDIAGLQAMAMAGESIGQTFTRLATTMAQFDDAFMTDAQKLAKAQKDVADGFKALGIAIPVDKNAFMDLVHGLDLTTEAGRAMFNALMALAPAFLITANAADQATTAQDPNALPPGYSWTQFDQDGYTTALLQAADAARQLGEQLFAAKNGLKDYVNSLLLNPQLSPLPLDERFFEAQRQYVQLRDASKGTGADALAAIGQLPGATTTYLELARQLTAGADYNAIYRAVVSEVGGIAGISQQELNDRLNGALPKDATMASSADIARVETAVNKLLDRISNGPITVSDPATQDAIDSLKTEVQTAGRSGSLIGG